MNNKGFAISTLIYGLSIMGMMLIAILMGIMSVNRSNNRSMSNEIEDELTKFSQTDTVFSASNASQTFKVPVGESGWYRIELWGASGGNGKGLGAYTSGVIELEEDDVLYFYVGKKGDASNGGGSTDVRLLNSSTTEGYQSRIMVAAGGGKNDGAHGGTLVGYKKSMVSSGGKLNITSPNDYNLISSCKNLLCYNDGAAYQLSNLNNMNLTLNASPVASNGGGSGFISSSDGNVGGTSYIAGYAGSKGISSGNGVAPIVTNDPGHISPVEVFNEDTGEPETQDKMFYFIDGLMFPGINNGDGKAKIERLVRKSDEGQKLVRRNNKLNNVISITDCVSSEDTDPATRISAIAEGKEWINAGLTASGNCRTATLTQAMNLDEIAVWHKAGKDYKDNTITVAHPGGGTETIKAAGTDGIKLSETETPAGFHISAYQPDFTRTLPESGNYYILPVLSENKVLTAQLDSQEEHNPIKLENVNGYKRQKWSIELITNPKLYSSEKPYVAGNDSTYEYKIVELARFRALDIKDTENKERNPISATSEFNSKARNDVQMWNVKAVGNGTYIISTAKTRFTSAANTGYIYPQLTSGVDHFGEVIIGINNNITGRYKLIAIDYSSS